MSEVVLANAHAECLAQHGLRAALGEGDLDAVRALTRDGCGLGFRHTQPNCLLSEVVGDATWRTPALIAALLDGGHPVEGMNRHNTDICPLTCLLGTAGHHDVAIFSMMLAHHADVLRTTAYNPYEPDIDEYEPVWVQVIRTGRPEYLDAMLASGWTPEAWRTWEVDARAPKRRDPLEALNDGLNLGPFYGPWQGPSDLAERSAATVVTLQALVEHGFDATASDLNASVKATVWYATWLRQHEHTLLHATVPASSCPARSRLRV